MLTVKFTGEGEYGIMSGGGVDIGDLGAWWNGGDKSVYSIIVVAVCMNPNSFILHMDMKSIIVNV